MHCTPESINGHEPNIHFLLLTWISCTFFCKSFCKVNRKQIAYNDNNNKNNNNNSYNDNNNNNDNEQVGQVPMLVATYQVSLTE